MPYETLLGLDAREMWLDFNTIWPQDRKDAYLLKPDLLKPLSTDTMVWPSVFAQGDNLKAPGWPVGIQDLWTSLPTVEACLAEGWGDPTGPRWIIAITQVVEDGQTPDLPYPYTTTPPGLDPDWLFLGYDVSDRYLLSGLSNCGRRPGEIQPMRAQFGPHLNAYHLFTAREPALGFKQWADQIAGHAPFYLYGLYRVRQ